MSIKRNYLQTSPDLPDTSGKRHTLPIADSLSLTKLPKMTDAFSWATFEEILDRKLVNVAKKDDLAVVHNAIAVLEEENKALRQKLANMEQRVEMIDRATRRANICISGLVAVNYTEAAREFDALCKTLIGVEVSYRMVSHIKKTNTFIFELSDTNVVEALIKQKHKLKNSNVFIQKDYTPDEREKKYKLRQLAKKFSEDKNTKIRLGEFSIFVNDRQFHFRNDNIVAASEDDAKMLSLLLIKNKLNYKIIVVNTPTDRNPSSVAARARAHITTPAKSLPPARVTSTALTTSGASTSAASAVMNGMSSNTSVAEAAASK